VFKLLPRAAYPQAGLQLIEALREYERELARRREQNPERPFYFGRNRSEFNAYEVLSEFRSDPLKTQCLHRQNWAKVRPQLYVSTHVTERDNFVIEVRPQLDTGFRFGGMTHLTGEGDFRHFPIYTAGFSRPTNRVMHLGLGGVLASFRGEDPWSRHRFSAGEHARERQILVLATRAKLHQLSLYFDCFVSSELVMFGPENYIDFRTPSGSQDPVHKFKRSGSFDDYQSWDPASWAPPQLRKRLAPFNLSVSELYRFATGYLATIDEQDQARVYTQYLDSKEALSRDDVAELFRCATDKAYRAAGLFAELTVDPTFPEKMKGHHRFESFCKNFDLTAQAGLEWLGKHHPSALAHIQYIASESLITYVRGLVPDAHRAVINLIDQRLAAQLARDEGFRWARGSQLSSLLDAEATRYGFASFEAFQAWAKDVLPRVWGANTARADRIEQHLAAWQAEESAKKQAATLKRKATLAAKKAAAAAGTAS
jgi:hypothetical protein